MTEGTKTNARFAGPHGVHFYESDADLAAVTAAHIASELRRGGSALVVATPDHLKLFAAEAEALGLDLEAARHAGTFVELDAAETLSRFMLGDSPDPDLFDDVVGATVRGLLDARPGLAVYGEMVALLWRDGYVTGAIELEELWNALLDRHDFCLLCAYESSLPGGTDLVQDICRVHSHATGDLGETQRASQLFDCSAASARAARQFVTEFLAVRGIEGERAAAIIGELAANALTHAKSDFRVTVEATPAEVRIEVHDASSKRPAMNGHDHNGTSGRGLVLVDAFAAGWGIDALPYGKVVWATITLG